MSVVKELIRTEANGAISFGNYELDKKSKLSDFKIDKACSSVLNLEVVEDGMSFLVEGEKDAQITVELEEDTEYAITIDHVEVGKMKTNLGGKLSISVELEQSEQVAVEIKKM